MTFRGTWVSRNSFKVDIFIHNVVYLCSFLQRTQGIEVTIEDHKACQKVPCFHACLNFSAMPGTCCYLEEKILREKNACLRIYLLLLLLFLTALFQNI